MHHEPAAQPLQIVPCTPHGFQRSGISERIKITPRGQSLVMEVESHCPVVKKSRPQVYIFVSVQAPLSPSLPVPRSKSQRKEGGGGSVEEEHKK